jgi:hypothetical protein
MEIIKAITNVPSSFIMLLRLACFWFFFILSFISEAIGRK